MIADRFGMAIAPDGTLWVADSDHNRFQLFAAATHALQMLNPAGTVEPLVDSFAQHPVATAVG
jgi:sugar lactone lactonase YvrE